LIFLHSLTDWEWCRENRHPVNWDDLLDRDLKVHITISTRAWVEQELEEPTLTEDKRSLYRLWLKQLENVSFTARRAEDGVWDLIITQDELTPARIAEYVRMFSQSMEDRLAEPYEFLAEQAT
jgi:hypothetical protein